MKPFRHLMLLLLLPALLAAEKDIQKAFYDNGNVKESFEVIARQDGKTGGVMKNYYPDGKLKMEMPIIEAGGELGYAPDGIVKTYYPNGKIESSVEWKRGKRNGPFEFYYNDGTLRERGEFTDDVSKTAERFTRSHEKQGLVPCLVVDPEKSRVAISEAVVLHVDNYHDTGAHLGWVFGYRRVGEEWKEEVKQARGDTISSRETKDISVSTKELTPGEWQFAVTSSVRGPEFYTEARSTKIEIEQAAPRNR